MLAKTLLIIPLSLLALLAACAASDTKPSSLAPQTAEHVSSGAELRNVMHRLNNLTLERNLTEPELDSLRRKVIAQVQEVTQGAENSLACILAAVPRLNLDAEQLKLFNSLADELREEVNTLRAQTEIHQLAGIPITLQKMHVTCSSCHEQFRSLPKGAAF